MTSPMEFWTLRRALLLALAFVATYMMAGVIYVGLHTRTMTRLTGETEAVVELVGEITDRAARLHGRVHDVAAAAAGPADSATVSRMIGELRDATSQRLPLSPFARTPLRLRASLSEADAQIADVESRLLEVLALLQLGRRDDAMAGAAQAATLEVVLGNELSQAQQLGLEDLLHRQEELLHLRDRTVKALAVWIGLGMLLIPLALWSAHRRVQRPLDEIERGLALSAAGDLTVRVPVARRDELGLLAEQFNQMTEVLSKRAEQQGRLAAAGELVAGVAHEVNNPLMAIALLAETRLDEPGLGAGERADLQQIVRQARRAGMLLSGLLRFARPGERVVEALDLPTLVRESLDLVSYQFGVDEIDVETNLAGDLPPVRCDRSRVEQVLVNLLSNAIQAVRAVPRPRRITVEAWREDDHVAVAIGDTGPGIPPKLRDRIFAPFFTTKGEEGTGLGLYISRQIMREDGGDLRVEPGRGGGARFVATLPVTEDRPHRRTPDPVRKAPPAPLQGIRVMVVDDEPSVRRPMGRFLERRGAQVREATDGLDALTKLERYTVDVILLDIRMPRMDGVEFFAELTRTHPALAERVVFVSGDFRQLEQAQDVVVPRERTLAKPVDLADLEAIVRTLATGSPFASSPEPPQPTR